jgi:hypothetical protein
MKGYKKISFRGDDLVPGIERVGDFRFANPSIVVDGEFYYRLKYMNVYSHIATMSGKLRAYIADKLKGEKE